MKKHLLPIGLLLLLWLGVVLTNYTPGTWLTGWDTLHPEFNFSLNIYRSFFAVWQEYQGLGLVGGMGHISALPQQLILLFLSLIIPIQSLRWSWTFLMLLVGTLGAYVLGNKILSHKQNSTNLVLIAATSTGIFYLFNLATVQSFFAPFEAFVTHFAVLPWLIWGSINILEKPKRKNILLYGIINFLGMTQAYIPTLFLVYLITLTSICLYYFLLTPQYKTFKRIGTVMAITFCINAMWLLPFAYFTLTNAQVVVNSKINQMATPEIYLKNQKYGDLIESLQLKNFWFENSEFNPKSGQIELMMHDWVTYTNSFFYNIISLSIILMIIFGAIIAIKDKNQRIWVFIGLLGFIFIANDTWPISLLVNLLRDRIPFLSQFFRFPFTKWGVTLALIYSLFWSISIYKLLDLINKRKILLYGVICTLMILPVIANMPVLQGKLISKTVHNPLPQEYLDLFDYMKTQTTGRIAYIPAPTYWDWRYYRWGYVGSGFIWYGLNQPILDNAFNSWSRYNEQYYWEFSYALYTKKWAFLNQVLHKYNVRYILFDLNLTNSSSYKALYLDELKYFLGTNQDFNLSKTFGKLRLYENSSLSDNFISVKSNLPIIVPNYDWTDYDNAYTEFGDYINVYPTNNNLSAQGGPASGWQPTTYYFPFRSLFTKRNVEERDFQIDETSENLKIFSQPIDSSILGSFKQKDSSIKINPLTNRFEYILNKDLSIIYDSNSNHDLTENRVIACGQFASGKFNASENTENDKTFLTMSSQDQKSCLQYLIPNLNHSEGYIVSVEHKHQSGRPLLFSVINDTAQHVELESNLSTNLKWTTSYFIIPPLANDGLGYQIYLANNSIGKLNSVNEISRIRFYSFPYNELVNYRLEKSGKNRQDFTSNIEITNVSHPNPAEYWVNIEPKKLTDSTLILSQSFHPGWVAFAVDADNWYQKMFPYIFGQRLTKHVLVNNWANGWRLPSQESDVQSTKPESMHSTLFTVYLFFWSQVLEFVGFALLPLPFLFLFKRKPKRL